MILVSTLSVVPSHIFCSIILHVNEGRHVSHIDLSQLKQLVFQSFKFQINKLMEQEKQFTTDVFLQPTRKHNSKYVAFTNS